jgi:N-acetylglucosaminyldiphosphoundecaprenol N-acetyl-beta-D-mannosaminyltransferase
VQKFIQAGLLVCIYAAVLSFGGTEPVPWAGVQFVAFSLFGIWIWMGQSDDLSCSGFHGRDLLLWPSMWWLGRRHGFEMRRRVYGPELMTTFCEQTATKGYRHFFYGGAPGVAEDLALRFVSRFSGVAVAGTYSPPFRALSPEEDCEVVAAINRSQADIVWVGLGTPKQERWMFEHRARLNVPVLVGVGAAFDLHAGRLKQAPAWMREHGLEWSFRLMAEPRRLWRRYLIYGSEFVFYIALEMLGLRKFR